MKEAGPDDQPRLRHAFRLCLARAPAAAEAERLTRYLAQQHEEFRAAPKEARALLFPVAAKKGQPAPMPGR